MSSLDLNTAYKLVRSPRFRQIAFEFFLGHCTKAEFAEKAAELRGSATPTLKEAQWAAVEDMQKELRDNPYKESV